jgi:hypothetical protein
MEQGEQTDLSDTDENESDNEKEIEYYANNLLESVNKPLIYLEGLNIGTNKFLIQQGIFEILIPPPKR